ncbi:MAG: class I SAM-dependent methyltransferase [Actinomycetota bacterium]
MVDRWRVGRLLGIEPPTFGGWALSADLALYLVHLVRDTRPMNVVELGAGSSTIVLGHALKRFSPQGRLISIEQDRAFLPDVRGLPVSIRIALVADWYDHSVMQDLSHVDLLFVDGPRGGARDDALPFFYERLASPAFVVMDDVDREAGRRVFDTWSHEFSDFTAEYLPLEKGAAVFTR